MEAVAVVVVRPVVLGLLVLRERTARRVHRAPRTGFKETRAFRATKGSMGPKASKAISAPAFRGLKAIKDRMESKVAKGIRAPPVLVRKGRRETKASTVFRAHKDSKV